MAITEAIRARIRRYIGDREEKVLTDAEIDTIYSDNSDTLDLTVVECLETILADATKLHAYQVGDIQAQPQQVVAHLLSLLNRWLDKVGPIKTIEIGELTYDFYGDDETFYQEEGLNIPGDLP